MLHSIVEQVVEKGKTLTWIITKGGHLY